MGLQPSDIEQVVRFVWETIAGRDVERVAIDPPRFVAGTRLASIIQLEGGATGRLILECPIALARRAAAHMFGEPAHELDLDRVQDAVAELTNVVAGNLKAQLPGPCRLGIPVTRILDPEEPSPRRRGTPSCSLAFRSGPDHFLLSFQGRTS